MLLLTLPVPNGPRNAMLKMERHGFVVAIARIQVAVRGFAIAVMALFVVRDSVVVGKGTRDSCGWF